MELEFEIHPNQSGIQIIDPVENVQFSLHTFTPINPTSTSKVDFHFPIDKVTSFITSAIEIPKLMNVFIRSHCGTLIEEYDVSHEKKSLPLRKYNIELTTAPIKLYILVESEITLYRNDDSVVIEFSERTTVDIGARSFHEKPAGTIRTTNKPDDMMRALSLLGSALKTTSCERSFPTLRGHPPTIRLDEELVVPDGLNKPNTEIQLILPPEYDSIFSASTLAYYLGAEVIPGKNPRILSNEFEYSLNGSRGYEQTVNRVLQQIFFLDCLTRTEGFYQVDLYKRDAVESTFDLDFADLYEQPLSTQLTTYLDIPFDSIAKYIPEWPLTTDILPQPENVELLPFVTNNLALTRCISEVNATSSQPSPDFLTDFYRSGFKRSASRRTSEDRIVQPDPAETIEHEWIGRGFPLGANKTTATSYRRRLEYQPPEKSSIDIHVVCNDERMKKEGVVNEFYGFREQLRFNVSINYNLKSEQLRELLTTPIDFFHYIGHIDDHGIRCADGYLDVRSLKNVNVRAFLLNACRSYKQGNALIEKGSLGGVVTLSEVENNAATRVGRSLARLLNCGFPLRVALSIAQDESLTGYRYIVLGDGSLTLVQRESGTPILININSNSDNRFVVELQAFPAPGYEVGTILSPNLQNNSAYYLNWGNIGSFEVSGEELDQFLDLEILPVKDGKNLSWSDEISASDF
ncbi:hypothetical protein [Haladaptatus halobius]|uniref:hypothetical protein n=1 Tax=Haladaptatus halobius TaxID=2884875 RepID=UPI001D0A6152|nr:hypothetical protein [Haladaptatus halobius]